jgi:hypothetical protein
LGALWGGLSYIDAVQVCQDIGCQTGYSAFNPREGSNGQADNERGKDTQGRRAITVSGSEIEGATVAYIRGEANTSATFSSRARAEVKIANC